MAEQESQIQEVVAEQVGTPTALELQLDSQKAIARLESVAKVIDGGVKISCLRTNPKDWVRMKHRQRQPDGSYKTVESFYLQATGAEKVRSVWGIKLFDKNVEKEINPDGSYIYIVTGKVSSTLLDRFYGDQVIMETEGSRSSADPFFTKDGREPDPMDVRKAAVANWEARSICSLLGLKNFTAADLTKNGIDIKQIAGFEFQGGAEGGGDTSVISQAQAKRLFVIAKEAGVAENVIKTHLKDKYGISSSNQIKRTDYEKICLWVQQGGSYNEENEGE